MLCVRRDRTPPQICAPVKDRFTTWMEVAPGQDTNEEGCCTEENDEALQLVYLGSDSGGRATRIAFTHSAKLDGPW